MSSAERSPYDPPQSPYPGLLAGQFAQLERDIAQQAPMTSDHDGCPQTVREAIVAAVESRAAAMLELSHGIHANPELGFAEHGAVEAVTTALAGEGHVTEVGAYGLPTALRASAGNGHPRVALLAEYDALPGIGHACGHNVICATAVGAFLALAAAIDSTGGSVELIGSPAEEGGGGKELIARAGAFDEIDAAVMLHPQGFDAASHPWIGVRQVHVAYHGLSAHASMMPFLGRNALDAVVQAYDGVAQLRQHMLSSDRVHGVITDGGQRPNVVPHYAAATFYIRSAEPETLAVLVDRAREVFEAAALSTGTQLELSWDPCPVYMPVRSNQALAARYAANVVPRGRRALPEGVVPRELSGSTDLGNVSVRVPAIHPSLAIAPPDVGIHSPAFAEWAVSARADAATVDGAVGLALTAADFLTDARLRKDVAAEFEAAGGVIDVESLFG